ncbi:glycoside hydrolase family 31 protein [Piedraia hortae CBS 480.64]|uniref:alpha-glucosidase n=1 Tax=Piedraia hortae CBS 480.64 TaxID=1314780 RepID=A0A6A7BXD2_9PEZI|nr:glycoside hydrolase family 31 protein [Piedraia hortae CBS 480.64]
MTHRHVWPVLLLLLALAISVLGVKYENFKVCSQSGFCRRNRAYADTAHGTASWESPYTLDAQSISFGRGILTGTVIKKIGKDGAKRLPLTVTFYDSGSARVTIDEEERQKGEITLRHGSKARKERYNEAEKWAIVGGTTVSKSATTSEGTERGTTRLVYGPGNSFEAFIRHEPFAIDFRRNGQTQIRFNGRGLLNVEHWRPKVDKPKGKEDEEPASEGGDESTWWEESFGGNTDTKPRGPESVALDIDFPGYEHVYGLAEHTGPLSLKETRGGEGNYAEPYRLYNSDVFEYIMDSPMTLYGSIPFMQAQKKNSTVGVFWLNAAETWVDITKSKTAANALSLGVTGSVSTHTHWISESGLLDVFVFLGPRPQDVIGAYAELTGYSQLPQQFAIAYHQCRWNYVTDQDVRDVDKRFDKHKIPYDVIWLDIEYTDGKKYFTWDPMTFANPLGMEKQLDEHGRKLVVIIDPHIKNEGNYHVVDELKYKDLAVHNHKDELYEGWCWPGSSYWVDCFNPKAATWWKGLFRYDKFKGTAKNVFIWNDMNEPSVFNGPETTMPKDNLHHGLWEHRDVHNLNGLTLVNATYEALLSRGKAEDKEHVRPFVLTRSFYAGSQRMGAMWTGDNQASWPHLAASIPMVLSMNIAGFPFAGADVGGFFGNPSKELLTRWYQTGAFYPFFRGHAHIDTRRREPYLVGQPYEGIITQALRLRYSLLPAWYTAFYEASKTGTPILQPNYYVHPADERGFGIDDQFYLAGTGLLAKPVVKEGQTEQDIYLADAETYYDYFNLAKHEGPGTVRVAAPLEAIPLLMQGGHIFARRDRPRRSSALMRHDPFTLVVTVDRADSADGSLYLDDGETFAFREGAYIHQKFSYHDNLLTSRSVAAGGHRAEAYRRSMADVRVEKVVIVGGTFKAGQTARIKQGSMETDIQLEGGENHVVVRNPGVRIGEDWEMKFM